MNMVGTEKLVKVVREGFCSRKQGWPNKSSFPCSADCGLLLFVGLSLPSSTV